MCRTRTLLVASPAYLAAQGTPRELAQHAVRHGELVEILPQWRPVGTFGRTIFALRPYTHRTPRNVRVLLDYLLEAFAGGFDADPAGTS